MKTIVFLSIFCVLALSQDPYPHRCHAGWSSFLPYCFKFYPIRSTFNEAERACRNESAHLASIHSQPENDFIRRMTRTGVVQTDPYENNIWIGLSFNPYSQYWTWTDGSRVDYTNWAKWEPNYLEEEHCGAMMPDTALNQNKQYNPNGGEWNNVEDIKVRGFICKRLFN